MARRRSSVRTRSAPRSTFGSVHCTVRRRPAGAAMPCPGRAAPSGRHIRRWCNRQHGRFWPCWWGFESSLPSVAGCGLTASRLLWEQDIMGVRVPPSRLPASRVSEPGSHRERCRSGQTDLAVNQAASAYGGSNPSRSTWSRSARPSCCLSGPGVHVRTTWQYGPEPSPRRAPSGEAGPSWRSPSTPSPEARMGHVRGSERVTRAGQPRPHRMHL